MEESKRELLVFEGFNKRFEELMPSHDRYQDAYEAVEKEFSAAFNHCKYKNYASFKAARQRAISKRQAPRVTTSKATA